MTAFEISDCLVCGDPVEMVLDYGLMPLAGAFYPEGDPRVDEKFPLALMRCPTCGHMQVSHIVPPEKIFSDYSYRTGTSPGLVEHFRHLAWLISARYPEGLVVDVGCNDGTLLNALRRFGLPVLGIDPSDISREASSRDGWPLVSGFLTPELAQEAVDLYGPARVVVASNVLAHTPSPRDFVRGLSILCPTGVIILEVHYQGLMLSKNQFDVVYHEHVSYFSLKSLRRLLEEVDLEVLDFEFINLHGGSIRVYATRPSTRQVVKIDPQAEDVFQVTRFVETAQRTRRILREIVGFYEGDVVAYGASGRGTTLLNWCRLDRSFVSYAVDASPRRQGRVVPGVRIPIYPPTFSSWPRAILLTAWTHAESIRRACEGYPNVFITPCPTVTIS
jgi:SAM-dependent methyltransferase